MLYAGVVAFPLVLIAWWLSRRLTSPIRALSRAVKEHDALPIVLPPLPNDEVGDLGEAIRAMSLRVHKDARAHERALSLGRAQAESASDVLHALEDALRAIAGEWTVVEAPEHRDLLRSLGQTESDAAPREQLGRSASIELAGGLRAMLLHDGERDYGVALAPVGARADDIRVAELLVRTAVTTLRRASLERQALVGEKLTMLGRLTASVAHEMNTPLAFVNANLVAMGDERLSSDAEEMLADARLGVDRIIRIVRDLSAVSAGGGGEVSHQRVRVRQLIDDMVRMAHSRRAHGNVRVTGDASIAVEVDRGRIEQVVLNLVNNAIDASGENGLVDVSVHESEGSVVIQVRDNGPGIPREMREQLFEAFHTTKGDQGTGLGLYISRSFVQAHGGALELVTSGPSGTEFRVTLPRARHPSVPAEPAPPSLESVPPPTGESRPRVLVIDDSPALVRAMTRWLGKRAVVEATVDVQEALGWLRTRRYDLILCDMNMPVMSGEELAREIRAIEPELIRRLVIVTGSTANPPKDLCVVRKPLDPRLIDKLLGQDLRVSREAS